MTLRRIAALVASVVLCAVIAAGCGSSGGGGSGSSGGGSGGSGASGGSGGSTSSGGGGGGQKVTIQNYKYMAPSLTVSPGAKVTFTNHDSTAHTASSDKSGVFDTGTLQQGKSKTVTLQKPGTYTYYCRFHAFMHGKIVVK